MATTANMLVHTTATGTSLSVAATVSASATSLVVFVAAAGTNASEITVPKWNGSAMAAPTGVTNPTQGSIQQEFAYVIHGPTTGTHNFTATSIHAITFDITIVEIQNGNTSTPMGTSIASAAGSSTISHSLTTAAGDVIVGQAQGEQGDAPGFTSGQTAFYTNAVQGTANISAGWQTATGTTTADNYSFSPNAHFGNLAVSLLFKAGSGGGGGRTFFIQSGLDGHSSAGPIQFNPTLFHRHPAISLEAYRREQSRKHREFMAKVRRAA